MTLLRSIAAVFARSALLLLFVLICTACARKIPLKPPVATTPVFVPSSSIPFPVSEALRPLPGRIAQLRDHFDIFTGSSDFQDALWGIKIVSLDRNEILYEKNSRRLIIPASNMKIVTAAAALMRLGPDFRYQTSVQTDGEIINSRLKGNLIVIGTGDPTISSRMQGDALAVFKDWADQLRAMGIRSIDGSIIGVDSNFDEQRLGPGWPAHAFNSPYAAEVSALQFNENVVAVHVSASRNRRLANVSLYPPTRYVSVQNRVVTRSGHANRFVAYRLENRNTIVLRGTIGTRDRKDIRYITVHEPAGYFAAALKETLARKGIRVRDSRRASREESDRIRNNPEQYRVLFIHTSPSLAVILTEMMKISHNLFAESVAKTIGSMNSQEGSIQGAQQAIREILGPLGMNPDELIMDDGSGLSSSNFVTANLLAQILVAISKTPLFESFYRSFPIAGVDGTLKNRMTGTMAEGNVRAKTGYIATVRSLSGYVTTKEGERLAFVMILNNFGLPIRHVDQVQDELCIRLAEFSRS